MIDHGTCDGSYVTTGTTTRAATPSASATGVSKGQVIGYVGTTGYSTGCHLHLMVWFNGGVVDPMSWF